MNIRKGYYIPDDVLRALQDRIVDHLEHDGHQVTAVYADGRRETFDSTITEEIAAADRKRWIEIVRESGGFVFEFKTTVTLDPSHFHGVITGVDEVIGWHVTTPGKLARYQATGCILAPVRFWRFEDSAKAWAKRTGRTVILRIETAEAYPMPDHQPRGHAWWTPNNVRAWEQCAIVG